MKLNPRRGARMARMQAEDGASAVEYGLILALLAVFILGALGALGLALQVFFNGVAAVL